jgi:hypothetical protein
MALALKETNAVEAAKLLLPRASLLEMTELAHELDVVAQFHYPGVRGWEDLDSCEKAFV